MSRRRSTSQLWFMTVTMAAIVLSAYSWGHRAGDEAGYARGRATCSGPKPAKVFPWDGNYLEYFSRKPAPAREKLP